MIPSLGLRSAIEFDSKDQVDVHEHDSVELCLVRSGSTSIDVQGTHLEGQPGTLYVLPAKVPHSQASFGRWRTQCVLFDDPSASFDQQPRTLDLGGDPLLSGWFGDLCTLTKNRSAPNDPVANALLLAVLTRLAESEAERALRAALHPGVARAIEYMSQHLDRDLAAAEIALRARTSYSHLRSLFHARFGHGPRQHHTRLRMERAQKLLLNPYVRVGEVAESLGYADLNYFVRVFRTTIGTPPATWRKAYGRSLSR